MDVSLSWQSTTLANKCYNFWKNDEILQLRVSQLQSLWRDKHPAIKGLRPPEHQAGKFRQDQKDSSESQTDRRHLYGKVTILVIYYLGEQMLEKPANT